MANRILVTGGAGFIGSNFVTEWLEQYDGEVINLDKLTYAGNPENLAGLKNNPNHWFIRGDIGDRKRVDHLLETHQPWAVVNFAAESHVDRSISGPDDFILTNVNGTFNLLESTREYFQDLDPKQKQRFRFLHVSTDEVYGSLESDAPAFTEMSPYAPNSPYSASKASSDHLVRAYYHTYGLPVLTTNCSNNYGPYQFPEKLIPLTILNALNGKPIPLYGDGKNIRDWLYVGDHCRAIQAVIEKGRPGEVYNVGGNCERTNIDIVRTICRILDELCPDSPHRPHDSLITFVTDRPGHDRRYAINSKKIKRETGWTPSETFETGIRKTVTWYLDHQSWVDGVTSGAYQEWIDHQYGKTQ